MRILVTGGRGLHRLELPQHVRAAPPGALVSLLRQADVCRQSPEPERYPGRQELLPRGRGRGRPRQRSPDLRRLPSRRRRPLRGGIACRSKHPRSGRVRANERGRHAAAPERGKSEREDFTGIPLPSREHRRGVRIPGGRGDVHGRQPLRPEQPVCGVEGLIGPPRARVSPHVRASRDDHELLQ